MDHDQPPAAGSRRSLLVRIGVLVLLLGAVAIAIADLIPGADPCSGADARPYAG